MVAPWSSRPLWTDFGAKTRRCDRLDLNVDSATGMFKRLADMAKSALGRRHGWQLIGQDLKGNSYYECRTLEGQAAGTLRRKVVPKDRHVLPENLLIPAEWDMWLRRRRDLPPSGEESESISVRQMQAQQWQEQEARVSDSLVGAGVQSAVSGERYVSVARRVQLAEKKKSDNAASLEAHRMEVQKGARVPSRPSTSVDAGDSATTTWSPVQSSRDNDTRR